MMQRNELERIYDDHALCAFAIFKRFADCDADARDLLQDWLVKLARGIDSLSEVQDERAYLMRIAYRHAVDWKRRVGVRKRTKEAATEENVIEQLFKSTPDPDREFLREALESSLTELPRDQQIAVQLRLWEGLSFSQIGDVIGVSTNTAASRYRYGIEKLRTALQPVYDEFTN
ncbi:MAG: RNA polymerase sigma factor [Verrucomicrobiales bacterium]|nr:RNA polymerase sigma factor [Verrucomicrobiales bacterium]